jgi:YesN/AraC family two-component response regulator
MSNQEKILIIDDEELILDNLSKILKLYDYKNIQTYRFTDDALKVFVPNETAVIITDVTMPEKYKNGVQMLAEIRKQDADVQFVIITGQNFEKEKAEIAINIGTCVFLNKPIGKDGLLNAVKKAIAHYYASMYLKNFSREAADEGDDDYKWEE